MQPNNRELEDLADRIRKLWISEHQAFVKRKTGKSCSWQSSPTYDGTKRNASGHKTTCIWLKIATFCVEQNWDYIRLVRAMFDQHKFQVPPVPTHAYGKIAEQRYHASLLESPSDVLAEMQIQLSEFERALFVAKPLYGETPEAVHYVLSDRALSLSALFRYCLAFREGFKDLMDLWKPDARRQYYNSKSKYDSVWGDCIPAQLSEDSSHAK